MSTCTFLGIWPEQIEDAGETADQVCGKYNIDADRFWDTVAYHYEHMLLDGHVPYDDLSNYICDIIFSELRYELEDLGVECDYYVNGTLDTSFYIDGEQV